MTTTFKRYADYYDLIYGHKGYATEAEFVHGLLPQDSRSLLEFGCGTGNHAQWLARLGHEVHGIDRSENMIEMAHEKLASLETELAGRLHFNTGDIRDAQLQARFDAVLSLFHVISYQTSRQDLAAAFGNAHRHLREGGLFLFDYWYGPAVLTQRPECRVARFENADYTLTRLARPELLDRENRVAVHYEMFVKERQSGQIFTFSETHDMRYLFLPEIEELLTATGFRSMQHFEFLTGKPLGPATWNGCTVARR